MWGFAYLDGQPSIQQTAGYYGPPSDSYVNSRLDDGFLERTAPLLKSSSRSVVGIFSGDNQVALGAVYSADGLILTKASEINEEAIHCEVAGVKYPAKLLGRDASRAIARKHKN